MAYTAIDNPTEYFSVNTWTADDSSPRSFTGFGHQPDLLWVKHRGSGSINPTIIDSVRGGDKMLATATDAAEDTKSHGEVTAFGSDGITVADGTNATYPRLYFNDDDPFGASVGGEYVCWSWKAGTAFSNDASATSIGSIDSSGSTSTTAGFSIVKIDSMPANTTSTFAHNLGVKPNFIIFKSRDLTTNWDVYHSSALPDGERKLYLNDTDGVIDSGFMNDTAPTSSVVSFNPGSSDSNHIAYCFADVPGYSKFGSYTGNGNADGTFVYTGFKPAFLLVKDTGGSGEGWELLDGTRSSFNVADKRLRADSSGAESTGSNYYVDFLSNGFKQRNTQTSSNGSGETYVYMAFAEAPFVTGSNGVPCNAR
jgi:hypothetical protein